MRLLHRSETGEFNHIYFDDDDTTPRYAIFSHTWGLENEEVTFEDIKNGTGKSKCGYDKIIFCAVRAEHDALQYFWIDTCCIDKSSSTELTEAINSMYQWYGGSSRCYVYLSDIKGIEATVDQDSALRKSRWFSRGWTLQELIAPPELYFYTANGEELGSRTKLALALSEITGVPVDVLKHTRRPEEYSVSERMSWIGRRQTKRREDRAYCLLGLFGVNMPLLYGEGDRAFQRLQREIMGLTNQTTGLRLLVVGSNPLTIETFARNQEPEYAILSHTWGTNEVSFQDVMIGKAQGRNGYKKIKSCCEQAARDGYKYLWVDTCCIDKTSSAELQEALCSMYKWYHQSRVCYAYLEDYTPWTKPSKQFGSCKWFTRGWTLQELIAPQFVRFFDKLWNEVGSKSSLCKELSVITKVDENALRGVPLSAYPVAEKMSWASSRSTSRTEDTAYSLMGIFDVFMPMLYGEGDRAFIRLQEEIMKQREDHTMFAWKRATGGDTHHGMFARSPAEFSHFSLTDGFADRAISSTTHYSVPDHLSFNPVTLTSRGIVISLPLLELKATDVRPESTESKQEIWSSIAFAPLRWLFSSKKGTTMELRTFLGLICGRSRDGGHLQPLCIWLQCRVDGIFVRAWADHLVLLPRHRETEFKVQTIYIQHL